MQMFINFKELTKSPAVLLSPGEVTVVVIITAVVVYLLVRKGRGKNNNKK